MVFGIRGEGAIAEAANRLSLCIQAVSFNIIGSTE